MKTTSSVVDKLRNEYDLQNEEGIKIIDHLKYEDDFKNEKKKTTSKGRLLYIHMKTTPK